MTLRITFGNASPFDWMFGGAAGWPGMSGRQTARFELIADVRLVHERIRAAQHAIGR